MLMFLYIAPARSQVLDGISFCRPDSDNFWCEGQGFGSGVSPVHGFPHDVAEGPYENQYVPDHCRSPNSTCIEAIMSNPSWSQGWGGLL